MYRLSKNQVNDGKKSANFLRKTRNFFLMENPRKSLWLAGGDFRFCPHYKKVNRHQKVIKKREIKVDNSYQTAVKKFTSLCGGRYQGVPKIKFIYLWGVPNSVTLIWILTRNRNINKCLNSKKQKNNIKKIYKKVSSVDKSILFLERHGSESSRKSMMIERYPPKYSTTFGGDLYLSPPSHNSGSSYSDNQDYKVRKHNKIS